MMLKIRQFLKKVDWKMVGVILVAIILRLALTPTIFHGDIIAQAGWGKWIFDNGIKGFYENNVWIYVWPNQPPLISLLYSWGFEIYAQINTGLILLGDFIARNRLGASYMPWLYTFIVWWGTEMFSDTPFKVGQLISMKLWPIAADFVLAYIIFVIVKKATDVKKAKLVTVVYLLSPFVWYESGMWGQHDQLGLIFLLLAFMAMVSERYSFWSPLLMMTSILLKPTALFFGPLLFWVGMKNKTVFLKMMAGSVLALAEYYWITRIFSDYSFVSFSVSLKNQMFVKGEIMTWANTFNLWRVITGYITDYKNIFLGLTLKTWGYVMFVPIYLLGLKISQKRDWWSVLKAMFVVGFGGWMTMVTMHDRYLFPAVVLGLILSSKETRLWKYWVVMSVIFWINMYNGWWTPKFMDWLRYILTFDNEMDGMVPKILSMVNVWLMVRMFGIVRKDKKSL